jgi:hypothetical protein
MTEKGLSRPEIMLLVNEYIGGEKGYLGDFSYNSHREFYPHYCSLDIDVPISAPRGALSRAVLPREQPATRS